MSINDGVPPYRAASVLDKAGILGGRRLYSFCTLTLSVIVSLLRKANNLDDHNQNAADGNDCLCVHGLTSFPEAARTDGTPASHAIKDRLFKT